VVKARKRKAAKKRDNTKKAVIGKSATSPSRKRPIREVEFTPLVKSADDIPEGNWEFVREQKMRFTKTLAYKIGDCPDVPWERGLSQAHCDYLAREMMNGNFISEDVRLVLCECREDGSTYRINGQHTCYARVEYMPTDWQPWVRLLTFRVDSLEHLRELYARYDRGRTRTSGNVIVARTFRTSEFPDIGSRSLKQMATGLRLFLWPESEHKLHPIDEVADLMLTTHKDLVIKVDSIIGIRNKASAHISRAPVIAAMFATCEKSFKGSQEFWTAVRDGEGLTKRSPQLTLRDFLQSSALGYGRGAGRRITLSRESMFRGCIFAWNKWRTNREMQIIKTLESGSRPRVHR
jgi:hypothetical protein